MQTQPWVTGKTAIKTHEVDPENFDFVMAINTKEMLGLSLNQIWIRVRCKGSSKVQVVIRIMSKDVG